MVNVHSYLYTWPQVWQLIHWQGGAGGFSENRMCDNSYIYGIRLYTIWNIMVFPKRRYCMEGTKTMVFYKKHLINHMQNNVKILTLNDVFNCNFFQVHWFADKKGDFKYYCIPLRELHLIYYVKHRKKEILLKVMLQHIISRWQYTPTAGCIQSTRSLFQDYTIQSVRRIQNVDNVCSSLSQAKHLTLQETWSYSSNAKCM